MRALIMMTAVTRVDRRLATQLVFDTVNRLGGWIDDTRMFSNVMNTIRLILPSGAFSSFAQALCEAGIAIDPPQNQGGNPDAERMATLQITFIHDEPDLRRDVPAIPG
ncbi:hypothetical protein ASE36_03550 [Rhizobium sp. Root274]|uniref:hypothetical protein n=1 Tax=unclassified Rhizobium TaxID=2613769 RepID=UPI000714235B|nr:MULTISPECIES: hypothetical protein [unclassified Rhizobium]KQW31345.1 hypothetical protein ASC71_03550 [Rhizobium sp. Root1240]KRD32889.1 hypothetical protein ASE36_03550 [Rhizobium sp. Root274]